MAITNPNSSDVSSLMRDENIVWNSLRASLGQAAELRRMTENVLTTTFQAQARQLVALVREYDIDEVSSRLVAAARSIQALGDEGWNNGEKIEEILQWHLLLPSDGDVPPATRPVEQNPFADMKLF